MIEIIKQVIIAVDPVTLMISIVFALVIVGLTYYIITSKDFAED